METLNKISTKKILDKAAVWVKDGLTQPGAMRLYGYVELEHVPTYIKDAMPKEALDIWDEEIGVEELDADIELWITTTMHQLAKLNIVQALTFVTPILADIFVLGKRIGGYEGRYRRIVKTFYKGVLTNRPQAEINVITQLSKLLKEVANEVGLKLQYDMDGVVEQIKELNKLEEKKEQATKEAQLHKNLDKIIDDAIKEYSEATGEDLLAEINKDPEKDLLGLDE